MSAKKKSKFDKAEAARLLFLAKKREEEREAQKRRQKEKEADRRNEDSLGNKVKTHYDAIEVQLKANTIGLVSLDEMKAKQHAYVNKRELQLAHKDVSTTLRTVEEEEKLQRKRLEKKQKRKRVLSFDPFGDEEEDHEIEKSDAEDQDTTGKSTTTDGSQEADEPKEKTDLVNDTKPSTSKADAPGDSVIKKKLGKDPTVDTSFLPDRDREEEEKRAREQLRIEWSKRVEKEKQEKITVQFSYWDGRGHRRQLNMRKGHTIETFLRVALGMLKKDFNELKTVGVKHLMFVKEDVIIAHYFCFHDFIVTKAQGKTGPIFEFDEHGMDQSLNAQDMDSELEKCHPAKICTREWYEQNKHIYPAKRWEPYIPRKVYDPNTPGLQELRELQPVPDEEIGDDDQDDQDKEWIDDTDLVVSTKHFALQFTIQNRDFNSNCWSNSFW